MRCPYCASADTRVIDSRLGDNGDAVRRRRECQSCSERFSTLEQVVLQMPQLEGAHDADDEHESWHLPGVKVSRVHLSHSE